MNMFSDFFMPLVLVSDPTGSGFYSRSPSCLCAVGMSFVPKLWTRLTGQRVGLHTWGAVMEMEFLGTLTEN